MLLNRITNKWKSFQYERFLQRRQLGRADAIFTHLAPAEKRLLFDVAKEHGGTIVEIGSYVGASSCFLAAGLLTSGKAGKLYCVDTWKNDAMTEGHRNTLAEFCENTKSYSSIIIRRQGLSVDVARSFDLTIDLLFLDGDHSYEGIKGDWDAWSPLLRKGSVVLFHDVGWAEGVQRVIAEKVRPRATSFGTLPNLYWAIIG